MVPEAQATHLAVTVGSDQGVDELTARRRRDGFDVIDGCRFLFNAALLAFHDCTES